MSLRPILMGALALVLSSAIVRWAGEWGYRAALDDLHGTASASLNLYSAALRSSLEKCRAVAFVLAHDNDVAMVLRSPSDQSMVDRANRKLEALGNGTRAAAVYVVDQAGHALAASNWRLTTSFVGQDYGFRSYVRAALAGGSGEQFSSGTVSQRAGYYLARRIETESRSAGAVVVKVEFDQLESEWQRTGGHVLVTDTNGVVLLADEPEWRFSTLQRLPQATRGALRHDMQYGAGAPLTPLPIIRKAAAGHAGSVVRVREPGMTGVESSFLEVSAPVPGTEWQLHRLEPLQPAAGRAKNSAMMAALLAEAAIASAVCLVLYRRGRARRLLEERDRIRQELERRVAERTAELSRAQDDLVQAAKLATLGQTAASLAHEVNQPLAAMRTYADNAAVLLARGRTEDVKANLASISSLTERIAHITQNLKGFARKASGVLGPVPVQASVAAALALFEHRIRRQGVRVAIDLPEAQIRVWAEQVRLEQVLTNILQNGFDALKGVANPEVGISVKAAGERVTITITDNGPGIAAEDISRAFSAFFTTKRDGLGLGLPISQGIVQDFGGQLVCRAHAGGGAEFAIELRRAP